MLKLAVERMRSKSLVVSDEVDIPYGFSPSIERQSSGGDAENTGLIFNACHNGSLENLKQIIKSDRGSINARTADRSTPLMVACMRNHEHIVSYVVKYVDVDEENSKGFTALMIACNKNFENIVEILLKIGAKPNLQDYRGNCALHFSCRNASIVVTNLLLLHRADIALKNHDGATPLYMACQKGNEIVTARLLHETQKLSGGNAPDGQVSSAARQLVNQARTDGTTPLMAASHQSSEALVACLLSNEADPKKSNKQGLTALHFAVNNGTCLPIIQLLLEAGGNPLAISATGITPLHLCCKHGNLDILKLMVLHDYTLIHHIDQKGQSFLHTASRHGNFEIVKELLAQGLKTRSQDSFGFNPLHLACANGSIETVELLLETGLYGNMQRQERFTKVDITKEGDGYLHLAASAGHTEVAERLLAWGCDCRQVNLKRETPLICAAQWGHFGVAEKILLYESDDDFLQARDDQGYTALLTACARGHNKVVRVLLKQKNLDCSVVDIFERTPLMQFCYRGNVETAKSLLLKSERNSRPFLAADVDGNTILHYACRHGRTDLVKLFIEIIQRSSGKSAGLSDDTFVSRKNYAGMTPLHIAVDEGSAELVALLCKEGADIDATGWDRTTPLHIACEAGRDDLAEILIKSSCTLNNITIAGVTPLHLACKRKPWNSYHGATYLLDVDDACVSSINMLNIYKETPLHEAVRAGNITCIKELLQRKADYNIKNMYGATALDVANLNFQNEASSLLCQHGAHFDSGFELDFDSQFSVLGLLDFFKKIKFDERSVVAADKIHFLSASSVANFERLPSFWECQNEGVHISADKVTPNMKLLYIIHEGKSTGKSDSDTTFLEIIQEFLTCPEADGIQLVWIDFCCIPEMSTKRRGSYSAGSGNLSTALLVQMALSLVSASTTLLIPSFESLDATFSIKPTTKLCSLLQKQWCMIEFMASMFAGSEAYCIYKHGEEFSHFQQLRYHSDGTLGLTQASIQAIAELRKLCGQEHASVYFHCEDMWLVPPGSFIGLHSAFSVLEKIQQWECEELVNILQFKLEEKSIHELFSGQLNDVSKSLGSDRFENETTSIRLLNLFLFLFVFSYKMVEDRELGTPLPSFKCDNAFRRIRNCCCTIC